MACHDPDRRICSALRERSAVLPAAPGVWVHVVGLPVQSEPGPQPVGGDCLTPSVDTPGDPQINRLSYRVYVESDQTTNDRPSGLASWSDEEEVVTGNTRGPS